MELAKIDINLCDYLSILFFLNLRKGLSKDTQIHEHPLYRKPMNVTCEGLNLELLILVQSS